MAQAILLNGGGGIIDSDSLSATANDVLKGYQYIGFDTDGEVGIGTLEFTGNAVASVVRKGKTFYNTSPQKVTGTLELTGNAQLSNVLKGIYFYNNDLDNEQEGTLEFTGTAVASDVYTQKTFYNKDTTKKTGTLKFTGNASETQVLSGKTFYKDGLTKLTGSMPNRGTYSKTVDFGKDIYIPQGYHNGSGKITATNLKKTNIAATYLVNGYKAYYTDGSETRTLITGTAGI